MEISTIYRVKYFVKHPWEVTEHFTYFKKKDDAKALLKTLYPKGYNNTSIGYKPVIEDVAVISDGKNSYCLGSPIEVLTEYNAPPDNETNTETIPLHLSPFESIQHTSPFASSHVNF